MSISVHFNRFSHRAAHIVGSSPAFIAALGVVVVWLATGPIFGFSDTWQLIINTGTTIVTFLMVFVIQNSQNRDAIALHLKLDELIRATKGARNSMIDLDKLSDAQLGQLEKEFMRICAEGGVDSGPWDAGGSPHTHSPSGAEAHHRHRRA